MQPSPEAGSPAIDVRGLTKAYGRRRGVTDVSFDVRRGEVFGFLGPNGAGKTTTIRVLLGLLHPDAGEARMLGSDVRANRLEVLARTGYLPGEIGLQERLRVGEQLRDFADLRGGLPEERIRRYADLFELDLSRPLRALSRGNKQKVGLVQALMHEPELLILDEPTSGLDPLMQQRFQQTIREARAAGRTVFLSSHVLSEVEHLCDRVAVIRDGLLMTVATVREIKERAPRQVSVRLARPAPASTLAGHEGITGAQANGTSLEFKAAGPLGPALEALRPYGVQDVATREPTLEDVFLSFYGGHP